MTRRDQVLISFLVAAFCLIAAAMGLFRNPDTWVGGALLGLLGVSCAAAGVSLLRKPPPEPPTRVG
jgi:hypothetical protein